MENRTLLSIWDDLQEIVPDINIRRRASKRETSDLRQIYFTLAREFAMDFTTSKAAGFCSLKAHGSVIHSIRQFEFAMTQNPYYVVYKQLSKRYRENSEVEKLIEIYAKASELAELTKKALKNMNVDV